jgi:signal transduction histidine kinase
VGAEAHPSRLRARIADGALSWSSSARWQAAAAAAVLPLAGTAVWLTLTGDHVTRVAETATYRGFVVLASMLVGLVWWRRRPSSRFGPLLVLYGVLSWIVWWQGSDDALVFTLGVLGQVPVIVLTFYLCLAFPLGRVHGPVDRGLMRLAIVAAACPDNPFFVESHPALAGAFTALRSVLVLSVAAAVFVIMLLRLHGARGPRRRALKAVSLSSVLLLPVFVAFQLSRRVLDLDPDSVDALGWPLVAARVIFPFGFLVALLQSELFAGAALRRLLGQLATRPTLFGWNAAVAKALDDPSLRIGYAQDGGFRDADGHEVPPTPSPNRLWAPVERDGQALAVIEGDGLLAEEPELMRAAAEATLVAVENRHLDGELRALRGRIVEAGDTERRRLARDLHDSTQQRLVALRVHLGLAEGVFEDRMEGQAALRRLGDELDAALDDLRGLVRGLNPPVLGRDGLAAALRTIIAAAQLPSTVVANGVGRYAEPIESAAYFCCLEGIQNAVKHAGPGTSVAVRLAGEDAGLGFVVEDDGRGFDPARVGRGLGLAGMEDRIAAVGGRVVIDSAAGRGTRVIGQISA